MAERKRVRGPVADAVTIVSRRRCCLCFAQNGDFDVKAGQIAHIDHDNQNNAPGNLAFLCLDHHNRYDSGTSQAKALTPRELRACRDALFEEVRRRLPHVNPPRAHMFSAPPLGASGLDPKDLDEYRALLLRSGIGFLLPANDTSILSALRSSSTPSVRQMIEHGHFTDETYRELLVLPAIPEYAREVADEVAALVRKGGRRAEDFRLLLADLESYLEAVEGR